MSTISLIQPEGNTLFIDSHSNKGSGLSQEETAGIVKKLLILTGNEKLKEAKILGDVILLVLKDQDNKLIRMAFKISELGKFLNTSQKEIEEAINKKEFDTILNRKIQERRLQEEPRLKKIKSEKEPGKEEGKSADLTEQSKFKPLIDPSIRQNIMTHLNEYGLNQSEFMKIETYYFMHKDELENSKNPVHIAKEITKLSRSLVYVPSGEKKGLYILLKSHGGVQEVGLGTFNRATLCLHVESGQKKVFRTAKAEKISPTEIEANKRAISRTDVLTAGVPVFYRGSWTDRKRRLDLPKGERERVFPHQENVEKVGFIMDLVEGGDLFAKLTSSPKPSYKERVKIAYEYAEALAALHELKLVHFDQKPENTFMTADGRPKISDFGFTVEIGASRTFCGTPGFIAPELAVADKCGVDLEAHPSADIWSLGSVLADIMSKNKWYANNGQAKKDYEKILNPSVLEEVKQLAFPDREYFSMDAIIDSCLMLNPEKRPTAHKVAQSIKMFYAFL